MNIPTRTTFRAQGSHWDGLVLNAQARRSRTLAQKWHKWLGLFSKIIP